MRSAFFALLYSLFIASPLFADNPPTASDTGSFKKTFYLSNFDLSLMYMNQKGGANLFTGRFAWTPSVRIGGPFRLVGTASVAPYKSITTSSNFLVYGLQMMLGIYPTPSTSLQFGGGLENWGYDHLSYYCLGGQLSVGLGKLSFFQFQSLIIGYSWIMMENNDTVAQFRTGLGFEF